MTVLSCIILAVACVFADTTGAETFTISGSITGTTPGYPVYVGLYNNEASFKAQNPDKSLRFIAESVTDTSVAFTFSNLFEGFYLIAAFQDFNGDRKLGMGMFGPTEPTVLYKKHTGWFAPKFDACKFRLDKNLADLVLRL